MCGFGVTLSRMYANTCWGFLGLAVTFGLAVLGLPANYLWLRPYFIEAAVLSGGISVALFLWIPLRPFWAWIRRGIVVQGATDLPQPSIAADLSLTEAYHLLNGTAPFPGFQDCLYQGLVEGTIKAWGRLSQSKNAWSRSGPEILIPQEYWTDSTLDWITIGPKGTERTQPGAGKSKYQSVRFNGGQIQGLAAELAKQKHDKRTLIAQAREFVVDSCAKRGVNTDFRKAAQRYAPYFVLRPYLTDDFRRKMDAQRTIIVPRDGATMPPLATMFLDELDRLEKEWGLR